ncbi:ABC-type transport auxiliary lipoprotein family protein [Limimaricola pyoseonensis]|uniref:Cholesterol transport system auxiliary component n=1 Tax=Limimaricola pyoseonensis TaxID=521013 RepID=A0A1G7JLD5_9RHOB|nr:ABC-type transport auxiliary lipoprotein family protein [Limimaricola pyoseonensis]SDF25713.1 cholesterol transport system auxiliary component [Limimaricola pyoseonensis]
MGWVRGVAGFGLMAMLTGCGALDVFDRAAAPLEVYDLRPPEIAATATAPLPLDVIVELPEAGGSIATDRIMIRPDPLRAQYLPDARWADPVPEMMQTLMVRSLGDSGALRYAGRRPLGVGGDYAVLTEIAGFHAEAFAAEGARIEVALLVRLVRESDAAVVATRRIEAGADAPSTDSPALAAAFDRASRAALGEFTGWLLGAVGAGS